MNTLTTGSLVPSNRDRGREKHSLRCQALEALVEARVSGKGCGCNQTQTSPALPFQETQRYFFALLAERVAP